MINLAYKNLQDALWCTTTDSKVDYRYGRGIVVGIVTALTWMGMTFEEAFSHVMVSLPAGYRVECIPESWKETSTWKGGESEQRN